MAFSDWVKPTFTDWDKIGTAGEILCHACQFCFTDQNEPLAKLVGKDKPQRTRNYSHFVLRGQWIPLSKGAKHRMRELLLDCAPEVAVIADSGQKHIIFRATPGWWQFEEQAIRPFPRELRAILDPVERLYNAGFSKTEIESGRYSSKRLIDAGISLWQPAEREVSPWRGSIRLQLALFLAQKERDDERDDSGTVA